MRQSQLFTKTSKQTPKDEVSLNAQLLIRAGFIHKELAGAYAYLPLGLRVLNKINNIIREEMDAIGGQELFLTSLQNPELWKKTDRWSDDVVDNWFKTKLKNDTELGLAFTHEEPLTNLMKNHINSYKDLPCYPYQIQTKFRNELRSKSGIMRCREFLMKDMYSFSRTQEEHDEFYEKSKPAYLKIFERCGLGDRTYVTFASGGVFCKYSHEFQTLTESGEDIIYVDKNKKIAVNKEVYTDEVLNSLGLDKNDMEEMKAVEVGNIFTLGTKYSEPLGLKFTDETGREQTVIMGSYGIGPGRVMGTIAEVHNDENGLIWPEEVAPFDIHLISLCKKDTDIKKADELYAKLQAEGKDVLYDDRDTSAGAKFADSDLIGIPVRYVISTKTLEQGGVEVKKRSEGESELVKF
ncbi:prolyl-tRNA synthetase [Patescibacteria group bacterium]|nr:prolyl-tRNA synthetase [Patescibacteria group bacterium]